MVEYHHPYKNPKFCDKCGTKLETTTKGIKYDNETGELLRAREILHCPRWPDDEDDHYYKNRDYNV